MMTRKSLSNLKSGWWFQTLFIFTVGEMMKFHKYFSNGLKPPPGKYFASLILILFVRFLCLVCFPTSSEYSVDLDFWFWGSRVWFVHQLLQVTWIDSPNRGHLSPEKVAYGSRVQGHFEVGRCLEGGCFFVTVQKGH